MFKCYLKEISRNLGLNILNKFSVEIYRIGSYSYYDHDPLKVPTLTQVCEPSVTGLCKHLNPSRQINPK